jgi:hypothetical protein
MMARAEQILTWRATARRVRVPLIAVALLALAGCAAPSAVRSSSVSTSGSHGSPSLAAPLPPPANKQPHRTPESPTPHPAAPIQSLGPADCGAWDDPTTPFVATAIANYGDAISCVQVKSGSKVSWIVVTDGAPGAAGAAPKGAAVGVDRCPSATSTCANGQSDHSADVWKWYRLPARQEARLGGISSTGIVKILGSRAIYIFDPNSDIPKFTVDPSFKPGS